MIVSAVIALALGASTAEVPRQIAAEERAHKDLATQSDRIAESLIVIAEEYLGNRIGTAAELQGFQDVAVGLKRLADPAGSPDTFVAVAGRLARSRAGGPLAEAVAEQERVVARLAAVRADAAKAFGAGAGASLDGLAAEQEQLIAATTVFADRVVGRRQDELTAADSAELAALAARQGAMAGRCETVIARLEARMAALSTAAGGKADAEALRTTVETLRRTEIVRRIRVCAETLARYRVAEAQKQQLIIRDILIGGVDRHEYPGGDVAAEAEVKFLRKLIEQQEQLIAANAALDPKAPATGWNALKADLLNQESDIAQFSDSGSRPPEQVLDRLAKVLGGLSTARGAVPRRDTARIDAKLQEGLALLKEALAFRAPKGGDGPKNAQTDDMGNAEAVAREMGAMGRSVRLKGKANATTGSDFDPKVAEQAREALIQDGQERFPPAYARWLSLYFKALAENGGRSTP